MTAEQAFPAVAAIINQVQDPGERKILETKILGAVESFEKRKARISAALERFERYKIKPQKNKKSHSR